ncbi:MAG TPA: GNAT family N-acetyltransferase, partial [Mycobacterium sp.]|nr:GNAT family N-acetyltransferase [Mycobacterium sp.]
MALAGHNYRVHTDQLFCGADLAQRIEAAETQLIVAATTAARSRGAEGLVLPVAGGFACFAEDGSPLNKVVGLGFGGVPDEAVLAEIERALAARHAGTQVELSNLADPEIVALLSGRGYRLESFENVLGRALLDRPTRLAPPGVEVRLSEPDELTVWLDVVVDGFAHPDTDGMPTHEEFPREIVEKAERDIEQAGAAPYLAWCDGVVAGGGLMRMSDGVALLSGAATVPAHRRRGVQTALLSARLADAAEAGCDIAVV